MPKLVNFYVAALYYKISFYLLALGVPKLILPFIITTNSSFLPEPLCAASIIYEKVPACTGYLITVPALVSVIALFFNVYNFIYLPVSSLEVLLPPTKKTLPSLSVHIDAPWLAILIEIFSFTT